MHLGLVENAPNGNIEDRTWLADQKSISSRAIRLGSLLQITNANNDSMDAHSTRASYAALGND